MNDKIVNISFNIWANSESEGEELKRMICSFIDWQGSQGRKVSAAGLMDAIKKMQGNPLAMNIVNQQFKQ